VIVSQCASIVSVVITSRNFNLQCSTVLLQTYHAYFILFQFEFSFLANKPDNRVGPVDCQAFLKDLDLEKQVAEESG
jgi:hypothetical protein